MKIGGIFTAAAAAAGGVYGAWLATDTKYFEDLVLNEGYPAPIKRLMVHLSGMATHLHVEENIVFTRNVIMALKIKNMAEQAKQEKENPLIAFNVGSMHRGIEDLIYLPSDVLRAMILYMDREFLHELIVREGDNIATTRLIEADGEGVFMDKEPLIDTKLLEGLRKQ